jgi:hypothetical protein
LPELRKALAGNRNHKVAVIAGVNHLMQTSPTGSPLEYSGIEETIAPVVLETIASWVLELASGPGI